MLTLLPQNGQPQCSAERHYSNQCAAVGGLLNAFSLQCPTCEYPLSHYPRYRATSRASTLCFHAVLVQSDEAAWKTQPEFVVNDEAYERQLRLLRAGTTFVWSYTSVYCPHSGNPAACTCPKMKNVLRDGSMWREVAEGDLRPVYSASDFMRRNPDAPPLTVTFMMEKFWTDASYKRKFLHVLESFIASVPSHTVILRITIPGCDAFVLSESMSYAKVLNVVNSACEKLPMRDSE